MRTEWHKHVDDIFDAWPILEQFQKDALSSIGSGLADSGPSHAVGGHSDPTASRAVSPAVRRLSDWFAHWSEARGHLHGVANQAIQLIRQEAAQPDRVNTAELCAHCNKPCGRIRRVDGQPYCAEQWIDRPAAADGKPAADWTPRTCYWSVARRF